jgi:hypothetical protein
MPQPRRPEVSVSGKRDLPEDAILTSVSIDPSDNGGFTVKQNYRYPEKKTTTGKSEPCSYRYIEPRDFTFESRASMLAHINSVFK